MQQPRPVLVNLIDRVYASVEDWLTKGHDAYVYLRSDDSLFAVRDDDNDRFNKSETAELVGFVSSRLSDIDMAFLSPDFGRA